MESRRHVSVVSMPVIYDRRLSSDPEESQATQLIQNVLGVSDPSARSGGAAHWNKLEDSIVNDSLTDTSSTGRSTSRYHLHGLAQTQSQVDNEDGMNEGSQKENLNGGGRPDIRDDTGGRLARVDPAIKITRTKGHLQGQPNQSYTRTKEVSPAKDAYPWCLKKCRSSRSLAQGQTNRPKILLSSTTSLHDPILVTPNRPHDSVQHQSRLKIHSQETLRTRSDACCPQQSSFRFLYRNWRVRPASVNVQAQKLVLTPYRHILP
jgi:hypothetical protein